MVRQSTFSMRTGAARLRSLPESRQLDLALCTLPRDVPTDPILHELIHHACANSAVNVAMQHRWLQLMRATISSPTFGYGFEERHLEMAANLGAAEAALQPIAEGLALFAEFDCSVPDPTDRPLTDMLGSTDAITCLLHQLRPEFSSYMPDIARAAASEKLGEALVGRRTDVLCQPLFPGMANDAYLVGYLAIKAVGDRFALAGGAAGLRQASVLDFLLYYFYEDWVLAGLLVTRGPIPIDAVVRRVSQRLAALLRDDLVRRVRDFTDDRRHRAEGGMLARGPEEIRHGPFEGLGLSRDEVVAGMLAVRAFHLEEVGPRAPLSHELEGLTNLRQRTLVEPLPPTEPQVGAYFERNPDARGGDLRALDFVLELPQLKRPLGTLIDLAVECQLDGPAFRVRLPGDVDWRPPLRGVEAPSLDAGVQPGRLVGVVMSTGWPWRLYCYLLLDGRVDKMWGRSWPDDGGDELRSVGSVVVTEWQFETATGLSLEQLTGYFAGALAEEAEIARQANAATASTCDSVRSALERAGWGPLFRGRREPDFGLRSLLDDGTAVRALAAAGLCNSFTVARDGVERGVAMAGHRLDQLISSCHQLESRLGVALLDEYGDTVRVRV